MGREMDVFNEVYNVAYNPTSKADFFRDQIAYYIEDDDEWLPVNAFADKLFVGLVESISRTGDGLSDEAMAELRELVGAYNEFKTNLSGGDAE